MNPTDTAKARMTNEGGIPQGGTAQGSEHIQASAQGSAAQSVDKATSGAHQSIDQAREAVRPAMDKAARGAHAAVDTAGEMATNTAAAIDIKGEQLAAARDELMAATRNYLQAHPAASIGMAVAAGFLLSRILSSR